MASLGTLRQSDGARLASGMQRFVGECTSTHRKTGYYNGVPVCVKFVQSETQNLTLSRQDLLEMKLVRPLCIV